ncbi:MAG: hypothetical protein KF708_24240 [Pirellulales bacterium]|nr:hypothetical protein [Pirellulales bacterium]
MPAFFVVLAKVGERLRADVPRKPANSFLEETLANKPVLDEADNSYRLSLPFQAVTVKQGDNLNFAVGISRGQNFSDEVAIKLEGLPSGVSQVNDRSSIERDKSDSQLVLKAADDAALGEFTVKVTGHTTSSEVDATDEFKLTVTSPSP